MKRPAWRTALECALCGRPFVKATSPANKGRRSRDHIIPKSWGGPTAPWNSRAVHSLCNEQRGNRSLDMDIRHLAANLESVVGPRHSLEDREAMAEQLLDAYELWKDVQITHRRLLRKKRTEVPAPDIPPLVRIILDGGFPWH